MLSISPPGISEPIRWFCNPERIFHQHGCIQLPPFFPMQEQEFGDENGAGDSTNCWRDNEPCGARGCCPVWPYSRRWEPDGTFFWLRGRQERALSRAGEHRQVSRSSTS